MNTKQAKEIINELETESLFKGIIQEVVGGTECVITKEDCLTRKLAEKISKSFKDQNIKAVTKSCKKNDNVKEFSFKSVLEKTNKYFCYEHIPFYMKGTDIVIDNTDFVKSQLQNKTCNARSESLGIEFKVFTDLKTDARFNVDFFRTGDLSVRDGYDEFEDYGKNEDDNKPEFIQNGFMTHCKEGQFLSDYCRTIRILSSSELGISCFCGICIYTQGELQDNIQNNMCNIIKYFHGEKCNIEQAPDVLNHNSLLYIKNQNGRLIKRVMCTLQNFELAFHVNVKVLNCGGKKLALNGKKQDCFVYPYIVKLEKGLTIGCT